MGGRINPEALAKRSDTPTRKLVVRVLQDCGAMLQSEICATLGLHRNTVYRLMRRLHESRLVFVESWTHTRNSNTLCRVWALRTSDDQRDAPKPPRKQRRDINSDYYARHKALLAAKQAVKKSGKAITVWTGLMT